MVWIQSTAFIIFYATNLIQAFWKQCPNYTFLSPWWLFRPLAAFVLLLTSVIFVGVNWNAFPRGNGYGITINILGIMQTAMAFVIMSTYCFYAGRMDPRVRRERYDVMSL